MADNMHKTDRRSFLKTGAVVAAPLAAAAPVAALADDGSRAELARLQAEREIEAVHRAFLRHVNGAGDGRAFAAAPVELDAGLRSLADHPLRDGTLELAADGRSATVRRPCQVELEVAFEGDSTLEKMARFQGQGSHRYSEERVLAAEYVKGEDGWRIASARFA